MFLEMHFTPFRETNINKIANAIHNLTLTIDGSFLVQNITNKFHLLFENLVCCCLEILFDRLDNDQFYPAQETK